MAHSCAYEAGDVLTTKGRGFLNKRGDTWQCLGTFQVGTLDEGDDIPPFHFQLILPKSEGGLKQIHRRDPTDLKVLLHQDRIKPHMSVWFWVAQLVHYGLYEPSVRHNIRRKMARRCRRILRRKLKSGSLTVPAEIRMYEEDIRAGRDPKVARKRLAKLQQASTEHGSETSAIPKDLPEEVQNEDEDEDGDRDEDKTDHTIDDDSSMACDLLVQTPDDNDDGDTSSVDTQFLQHRRPAEATYGTYTDDEDLDNESTPNSLPDFRYLGAFSPTEVQVLHDWRDRFCMQHDMTLAEFQVMMTRSHCQKIIEWTYDFISKAELLQSYRAQLPIRDWRSLLNFRGRHDWDPPKKRVPVRKPLASTSSLGRRRSRLSMLDDDEEEEIDSQEVEFLESRAALNDANIWELRATEAISDDENENSGIPSEEQNVHGSTPRVLHGSASSSSCATSVQSRTNLQNEQDGGEEETSSDVNMADVASNNFDNPANEGHGREASYSKAVPHRRTGRSQARKNSVVHVQTGGSTSGVITESADEVRDSSVPATRREVQESDSIAHSSSFNEIEDAISILSIPSSTPGSKLPGKLSQRSSIDPSIEIPQTPIRSILRNKSPPRSLQLSKPQAEKLMNSHNNLPTLLAKTSSESNALQAIKRIAGSYGILFTQISQIQQEKELDDLVAYVSNYAQNPSGETLSRGIKNRETDTADHLLQQPLVESVMNDQKRRRSPDADDDEASNDEGIVPPSPIGQREGQESTERRPRGTKRLKSTPDGPNSDIGIAKDKTDIPIAPASTPRASSLQIPRLTVVRSVARSASYPSTPSDSQTGTPYNRSRKQQAAGSGLNTEIKQSERAPSFEFPSPAFPRSGLPIRRSVNDQDCSSAATAMKKPTSLVASEIDRNKPYGSQANPHVIPATPRAVRTVTLAVKDEPREASLPPNKSARLENDLKGTNTGKSKKRQPGFHKAITPGPVRSTSTFGNPTPPSVINQGISQFSNLRLNQSFSTSPTFTEVMRQDDRLFRKNQPKAVNNPTRNPVVQAQVADARLDDHSLEIFDTENNEAQDDVRVKRSHNDALSRQPHRYPSLFLQEQSDTGVWHQQAQRSSGGSGSQRSGQEVNSGSSTSTKENYNLGIPGVWRNRRSG